MKKAKTDTGLIKKAPDARARASKKTGEKALSAKKTKARNAKTTEARDAKTTEAKKPRKQGGKGRPFRSHDWGTYAPGNKAPRMYSEDELRAIVKKAAKAANTRIRTLEKKSLSDKSPAYKWLQKRTEQEKPRFKEGVTKMTRAELEKQFISLREFMIKKTSTVTGYRESVEKKVERAREMGFTGTPEELGDLFDRYMTEKNEQLYGSEVIYQAITSNQIDNLQQIAQEFQGKVEKDKMQGAIILQMLRNRRGR
jgi:hypothetical protein|nr:MAG TPA: hypothetical protein [Caudoviricetes sp.]